MVKNIKEERKKMMDEMKDEEGKHPELQEADCKRQQNGNDCGPFIMGYMEEAIDKIIDREEPAYLKAPNQTADKMREDWARIIDENMKGGKEEERGTERKKPECKVEKQICKGWLEEGGTCPNRDNCKETHPMICQEKACRQEEVIIGKECGKMHIKEEDS